MVQNRIGLEDLKTALQDINVTETSAQSPQTNSKNQAEHPGPKLDSKGRVQTTGKRKSAIAKVWLKPGSGKIIVNGRENHVYFARPVLQMIINQPFEKVNREAQFDIVCSVAGGGLSGQAGALRHGISKALLEFDPSLRSVLKEAGFITRDSRVVESKKYGRAKARRSFQFSKR